MEFVPVFGLIGGITASVAAIAMRIASILQGRSLNIVIEASKDQIHIADINALTAVDVANIRRSLATAGSELLERA